MTDQGKRQLPCGCWQRWIVGDIITSRYEGWVTFLPCDEHSEDE